MKRVLFLLVLSVFVLAVNAQDSISSTIGRFLKNKTQIEGKIIFKKIKSNDTIEYYAFGKDSRKLIYYYTTAKNEKGKNSLTGPRFYFTNNQLIYLYFFLGYLSSKGNGKMAKKKHFMSLKTIS